MIATFSPWRLSKDLSRISWVTFGLILVVAIGLRHEVGGDWFSYLLNPTYYEIANGSDLDFSFGKGDYGYEALYWFSVNYLNGIYATNLICAIIFVSGLYRLCSITPFPWVGVAISIPIFVIIVSMGYTRQSAAIGFLMWGIVELLKGRVHLYYVFIILGILFHKSLIIMLLFGYYYNSNDFRILKLLPLVIVSLLLFSIFLSKNYENLIYYYVSNSNFFMFSSGGLPRVLINVIPAMILLYYRERWVRVYSDYKLWYAFSILSILLVPFVFYVATFSDRISFYMIPAQIVILSRIPILINSIYYRSIFIVSIFFIYTVAMFTWLNFGSNSIGNWVPYKNILLP